MSDETDKLKQALVEAGVDGAKAGAFALAAGPEAAGFAAVATAGYRAAKALWKYYLGGGEWVRQKMIEEAVESLEGKYEALEENFRRLNEATEGAAPMATDFNFVARAFLESWAKTADQQKRELLKNAMVNAFDPNLYEAGITSLLFRLLDQLSYGELYLLRVIVERKGLAAQWDEGSPPDCRDFNVMGGASIYRYYAENLNSLKLANLPRGAESVANPNPQGPVRAARILRPTELGVRLAQLVRDTDQGS